MLKRIAAAVCLAVGVIVALTPGAFLLTPVEWELLGIGIAVV